MTKKELKAKAEKRKCMSKSCIAAVVVVIIIVALAVFIVTALKSRTGFGLSGLKANIALIKIESIILTKSRGVLPYSATYSDEVIKEIKDAMASPTIKAIIFEINSPGGSAVASSEIAEAIKAARQANKTTVALIREQGTSGAYWIASSCEHIISHPLALTGSIGVLTSYLEISELLERYNITYERLAKGKHKDVLSPYRKLSNEERLMIEKKLDIIYQTFIQEVAQNRNISDQQVQELADGMFYVGKEAKELGLVDELGSKQAAIAYIEAKHNIKARIKEYKKTPGFFEKLMSYQLLSFFWLGRGIGASLVDKNLLFSLNTISPQT